jgi:quinol---cytochrome c reductase iron-sulfur subunit, bacillus type
MMREKLPPPSPEQQESTLQQERVSRRTFLMKLGLLLNGAIGVVIAIPVVRYLLGPVRGANEYRKWVEIGSVDGFKDGETTLVSYINPFTDPWDGETRKIPAYVRRVSATEITVFAINCAHLGCPVRWFAESELFMCPCHGGAYYANGERASGPPPRGLFKYDSKIENGKLLILAGQLPTLSNQAGLIQEISPCPGTDASTIG